MPKIKSHRGVAKRFWISGTGKVKHKKAGLRHLLTGMDGGRGRHMRKAHYLNKVDSDVIKKLIPYR
jgi:large subunit ribosomal protein L35